MIKSVNLLDAVNLLSETWKCVKQETISNCYKHAEFTVNEDCQDNEIDVLDDVSLPGSMTREELEAHIEIDEELVQEVKGAREEEDSPEDVPTDIAVLDALKLVRSYA